MTFTLAKTCRSFLTVRIEWNLYRLCTVQMERTSSLPSIASQDSIHPASQSTRNLRQVPNPLLLNRRSPLPSSHPLFTLPSIPSTLFLLLPLLHSIRRIRNHMINTIMRRLFVIFCFHRVAAHICSPKPFALPVIFFFGVAARVAAVILNAHFAFAGRKCLMFWSVMGSSQPASCRKARDWFSTIWLKGVVEKMLKLSGWWWFGGKIVDVKGSNSVDERIRLWESKLKIGRCLTGEKKVYICISDFALSCYLRCVNCSWWKKSRCEAEEEWLPETAMHSMWPWWQG